MPVSAVEMDRVRERLVMRGAMSSEADTGTSDSQTTECKYSKVPPICAKLSCES